MIPDTFADQIHINAWPDPVIDQLGHDPRSQYVEWFWLSVLGPSTIWLLRRVGDALDHAPDGFTLDVNECGAALVNGLRLAFLGLLCRFRGWREGYPRAHVVSFLGSGLSKASSEG